MPPPRSRFRLRPPRQTPRSGPADDEWQPCAETSLMTRRFHRTLWTIGQKLEITLTVGDLAHLHCRRVEHQPYLPERARLRAVDARALRPAVPRAPGRGGR